MCAAQAGTANPHPPGVVVDFTKGPFNDSEVRSNQTQFENCIMIPVSAVNATSAYVDAGGAATEKSWVTDVSSFGAVNFDSEDIKQNFTIEVFDWNHNANIEMAEYAAVGTAPVAGTIAFIDLYFSCDVLTDTSGYGN
jgi:hypothetical protein